MRYVRSFFTPLVILLGLLAACSGPQTGSTTAEEQAVSTGSAIIRFVHAIPDAPAVEVWVGNTQVASSVGYGQWTEWVSVPAGEQDVTLRRGEFTEVFQRYTLAVGQRYMVIGWGVLSPVGNETAASLLIEPEPTVQMRGEDTWIRFANAMAQGEALGLVITTEGSWDLIFPNQPLGTVSDYQRGPLYQNSFQVIPARDTSLPAVYEFDHHLQVGIIFTFVMAGRQSSGQYDLIAVTDYNE